MRIVIPGGSGFLGRALSRRLAKDGHTVVVLTRDALAPREPGFVRYASWTPDGTAGAWAREFDGADAVINMAGAGIADKRWTSARKQVLRQSRVLSTRSVVAAIRAMSVKPAVLIQGSGAGYYGSFDIGPTLDESSPPGSDFLGVLCVAWEAEAQPAAAVGVRVVFARTSPVLARGEGALAKMVPPFKLFVGGPLGTGRQIMAWIHIDDWVAMTVWALNNAEVAGPVNFTAPHPVSNAEFSQSLGRALGRPSWLAVPAPALRLLVGEMADAALLRGARVVPTRALTLGYKFKYERIDEAMRAAIDG